MIDPLASLNDQAATVAAVAAVGSTPRHILLATEADAAIATPASLHFDFNAVDKHDVDITISAWGISD
jgi:hypothetical protein